MKQKTPKIAVIGAGPSGLTSVKNLLEAGFKDITVFEQNARLGGNWVYDEKNVHASVYETTHLISSKRLSQFEDFPMPPEYPDYPSHRELLAYFESYATHFNLRPYLRFNTKVICVEETSHKDWKITYQDSDGEHEETFTHLFIANGHHWKPLMPDNLSAFQGNLLHSHDYKSAKPFKDKRVLVIGGGNSACDVAVEVARVAEKTCISIRRGQHIFPKFMFGKPTDVAFSKINWMPFGLRQRVANFVIRLLQGRYSKYGLLTPDDRPLKTHPVINSELLYFIRHGKIFPRHGIVSVRDNLVEFTNGTKDIFDTIICATGYEVVFPFFRDPRLDFSKSAEVPLYLKMMHPEFPTLFFIGLFQPQGAIWPLAHYQAKIAANIIAKKCAFPENIEEKITQEKHVRHRRYHQNIRHALEVDYHDFRNELVSLL